MAAVLSILEFYFFYKSRFPVNYRPPLHAWEKSLKVRISSLWPLTLYSSFPLVRLSIYIYTYIYCLVLRASLSFPHSMRPYYYYYYYTSNFSAAWTIHRSLLGNIATAEITLSIKINSGRRSQNVSRESLI